MKIGIVESHLLGTHLSVSDLKKYFIAFDKLYAVHLGDLEIFYSKNCPIHGRIIKEVAQLRDKGYLASIEEGCHGLCGLSGIELANVNESFDLEYGAPSAISLTCLDPFGEQPGHIPFYCARHYCYTLNSSKKHTAIPIIPYLNPKIPSADERVSDHTVLNVVINKLPVPDNDTSWEKLQEFKNDPDTKYKFEKLQLWMRRIARGNTNIEEIEDQLEENLLDYNRHMELYKIESRREKFQGVFVALVDAIQNLIYLKPKLDKVADSAFSLTNTNIKLMKEEMKAPGSEVAYISKAQNFIKPHKC